MVNLDELKFDEKGLIPAIVVDAESKKVLTLAYMNRESLEISIKRADLFYSLSAGALAQRRDQRKLPAHRIHHCGLR